jgi:hypothetical protein
MIIVLLRLGGSGANWLSMNGSSAGTCCGMGSGEVTANSLAVCVDSVTGRMDGHQGRLVPFSAAFVGVLSTSVAEHGFIPQGTAARSAAPGRR